MTRSVANSLRKSWGTNRACANAGRSWASSAKPPEQVKRHGVAENGPRRADEALEQERLGAAGLFVVGVESGDEGNSRSVFGVWRRMMAAMTWNSSADMGMTRSRSVLEGAMTRRATTSPLGRWYWRMLR